jgi:aspartyl-tRNA(Asn)/glutamyl-tRNA(Gln) amidotransferase subunit B
MRDYGLPASDAQTFVWDVPLGTYFEGIAKQAKNPKAVANWVINNLRAMMDAELGVPALDQMPTFGGPILHLDTLLFQPACINELVELVESRKISSTMAQDVFKEMFKTGKSPTAIVQEKGLAQVSDPVAIEKLCDEVMAANPGPANDFKSGKAAALNFLKGQVMKLSKGKANPALVGEILEQKLKS